MEESTQSIAANKPKRDMYLGWGLLWGVGVGSLGLTYSVINVEIYLILILVVPLLVVVLIGINWGWRSCVACVIGFVACKMALSSFGVVTLRDVLPTAIFHQNGIMRLSKLGVWLPSSIQGIRLNPAETGFFHYRVVTRFAIDTQDFASFLTKNRFVQSPSQKSRYGNELYWWRSASLEQLPFYTQKPKGPIHNQSDPEVYMWADKSDGQSRQIYLTVYLE